MDTNNSSAHSCGQPVRTRDEVLARLRAHEAELRAAGVEALWLFGSFARDEAGPESDVDLMFDRPTDRRFTLFDLEDARIRMEGIVGRDVDLGSRGFLKRPMAAAELAALRIF